LRPLKSQKFNLSIHQISRWFLLFFVLFESAVAQNLIEYSYVPKVIYPNQLFPVTLMVKEEEHPESFQFQFDQASVYEPISQNPLVVKNGSDLFFTFYFKALFETFILPQLTVYSNIETITLPERKINYTVLNPPANFSGVIATDLEVVSTQVSNYDTRSVMSILHIEANEANLEEMRLQGDYDSGIDEIRRKFAKVTGDFFAVLPTGESNITMSYYNTTKNRFEPIPLPTEIKDIPEVSEEITLNPVEDNFDEIKEKILQGLVLFFFVMAIFKRDLFYLAFAVLFGITLYYFIYIPEEKVCVRSGVPIYILPTKNSTIGGYTDQELILSMLARRASYTKIEYKKGMIGWVTDNDLCKD